MSPVLDTCHYIDHYWAQPNPPQPSLGSSQAGPDPWHAPLGRVPQGILVGLGDTRVLPKAPKTCPLIRSNKRGILVLLGFLGACTLGARARGLGQPGRTLGLVGLGQARPSWALGPVMTYTCDRNRDCKPCFVIFVHGSVI